MQLEWTTSLTATGWYLALAESAGWPPTNPGLAAPLRPLVAELVARCAAQGVAAQQFLKEVIARAPQGPPYVDVTAAALDRFAGRDRKPADDARLADILAALLTPWTNDAARVGAELALRVDPLRIQWEARGPGLLAGIARLTRDAWLPPAARVALVQPVCGGGGLAHARHRCVTFEAVLANPLANLPETLRLGWLLAQLSFDAPAFVDPLTRHRLNRVGHLALLPIVLAAAEDVEWATLDEKHLTLAGEHWTRQPVNVPVLMTWWETYRSGRASWLAALAALDTLLSADESDADRIVT